MGQQSNDAASKDVQIKLSKEECAEGMGQRSNYAALKDVQIKLRGEEYALSMVQMSSKLCIIEDCTNQVQKGGVCKRHGAYN